MKNGLKRKIRKFQKQILVPLNRAYSSHYQSITENKEMKKVMDQIYNIYIQKLEEFAEMIDDYIKK